jgi:hypothetical protein
MQMYDLARYVQTETHACQVAVVVAMCLVEAVKHGLSMIGWDADSVVNYRKARALIRVLLKPGCYDSTLRAELDGVVD